MLTFRHVVSHVAVSLLCWNEFRHYDDNTLQRQRHHMIKKRCPDMIKIFSVSSIAHVMIVCLSRVTVPFALLPATRIRDFGKSWRSKRKHIHTHTHKHTHQRTHNTHTHTHTHTHRLTHTHTHTHTHRVKVINITSDLPPSPSPFYMAKQITDLCVWFQHQYIVFPSVNYLCNVWY